MGFRRLDFGVLSLIKDRVTSVSQSHVKVKPTRRNVWCLIENMPLPPKERKTQFYLFIYFFGFHTGCPSQLTCTSINLHSQLELATSHKLLQLLELELKITPSRTPEFYPVVDKPLNPTWWLKTQNFIQLLT